MARSSHRRVARLSDQAGFSLIELLVAMLISLIVIGGGTFGMAMAFRSSTETVSRTAAGNGAEVRFEALTRDIRQVVECPYPLSTGASSTFSGFSTAAIGTLHSQYGLTLKMCDPASGLTVQAGTQVPPTVLVTWTCAYTTESCTRQTQNISGNSVTGSAQITNIISGVTRLTLTSLTVKEDTALPTLPSLYTFVNLTSSGISTGPWGVGGGDSFGLSPSNVSTTILWITWVGITAQVASLAQPDSTSNLTQANGTAPVTFSTGITLRNAVSS